MKNTDELHWKALDEVDEYAILMLDKEGHVKKWNKGAEKLKGYRAEEVLQKSFSMFYTIEDLAGGIPGSLLKEAANKGKVLHEGWRVGKDNRMFWTSEVITALHDDNDGLTGFITISRPHEGQLAQERFRLVVESAPNAMVLVNRDGKINLVNGQTEKLFGYTREELIDHPVELLLPEQFKHHHPQWRDKFMDAPKTRTMGAGRDLFARRKNGTEFPVEIGLNPMETPEGPMVLAAIIDITERKRAEERFRLVVESAPNAIVLINQDGRIALVNGATEKLFGYERHELLSKEVELLIPPRFRAMHPHYRTNFFAMPQMRPMGVGRDLYALRKDGSEFPVEIGLNPIESQEGNLVLASIIDITERKILEANRLKSDFLANMSHELRTPLNAILGFSELLIDQKIGPLNERQKQYLQDVHESGSHLLQLINNVLDLAKIESGKTELSVEIFSLSEVITGVINTLESIAAKKEVTIRLELSKTLPIVRIDKNKFRQILYNLLSNAIKFNREHGEVLISAMPHDTDSFMVRVTDTGIGINKENLKKLFIPFVQLDSGMARQHEGSGLGLALTKNIVELHHGQIGVDSEPGTGTTFWIIMPLHITLN